MTRTAGLALTLVLALGGATQAQTGPPLDEALRAFTERRGLRLVYDGALVAGRRTSCPASVRASDRPVEAVLACLLEGTGLEARRLPSGTVALYRADAQAPRRPASAPRRAPPAVAVRGVATDAATGEALIGAAVYAPALGRGTTTNAYGFYSLSLPPGPTRLVTSYVGYVPDDTTLALGADARRDLALRPDSAALGEVVVVGGDAATARPYASVALTGEDVQALPAVAGEADLLKALQLQPGVGGGVEGTAGLHVRGGSPDQTLVLLDGIPVYNASHLFGFLSTFNADAVRRVELFKGGFPARYGGRLSSVVDVRMREGNDRERRGHARVGLLSGQALVEGPVRDGRGAYLVAARRTYLDLFATPVLAATGGIDGVTPSAYFYDLNAKANARLGDRDRVYASLYAGRDRFSGDGVDTDGRGGRESGFLRWGNATGALRWTRVLGPRLFAATTATASDYRFDVGTEAVRIGAVEGEPDRLGVRYRSGVRDLSLQTDLDWTPGAAHTVRLGAALTRHRHAPGVFDYDPSGLLPDTTLGAEAVGAWSGAVYVEDEARWGPALLSAGVRATGYAVEGAAYGSVEPRLGARVGLGRGVAVRGSVARMTQYLHRLTTVGGIGLPADLWVPATARVGPARAWQGAAGVEGAHGPVRWSLDGYTKAMDGLVTYREAGDLVRADADWQDQVAVGTGRAYGAEAAVTVAGPRTSAQAAYTWSRSTRRFDEVDDGAAFSYRYDRTHDFAAAVRHRLSRRLDVSAAFVYRTGQAVTLPEAQYFAPLPGIDLSSETVEGSSSQSGSTYAYGPRNGFRLPATHRLDVGLDVYFRRGPRPHALSVEVYNAYNRANAAYVEVGLDPTAGPDAPPRLVARGFLPVIPSVSYEFSF